MEDSHRALSAKNSRRRRWEVKTKESFEASLAVEIDSPQETETANIFESSKDGRFHSGDDNAKDRNANNFSNAKTGQTKHSTKPSAKTPSSKPSSAKSRISKPSSAKSVKSKPLSGKSTPTPKCEEQGEKDLLSAKLGALIDEANVKGKDSQKRSAKEKGKDDTAKDNSFIDEANAKGKDAQKLSAKEKGKGFTVKEISFIDEAYAEGKDSQKQSAREKGEDYTTQDSSLDKLEKGKDHIAKVTSLDKFEKDKEKLVSSGDPIKEENLAENNKFTEDESSTEPSAPPLPLSPEEPIRKKRHKKKRESKVLLLNAANEESFISLQLKEMKDDIVDITKGDGGPIIVAPGLLHATSIPTINGNINAMFQEHIGGFVMTNNDSGGIRKLSERLQDVTQIETRTSYAIFLQSGFRTFSVLCQGLLAGITLAHCLVIFLLDADPYNLPVLYNSRMAHIFYALIMFLTTICFVSACDRCDVSGAGVLSGHGIKIPWTPGFYLTSLVLSLVAVRTDDVLTHQAIYQGTLQQEEVKDLVEWWRWMCVARSSAAVLAWLAVVPDPHTDALLDSLQELHRK